MRAALAALLMILTAAPAAAEATLADFAGRWRGVAVGAAGAASPVPAIEADELDLEIVPRDAGFLIRWTAVALPDAGVKPAARLPAEVVFEPAGRPGLFRAVQQAEPLEGELLSWARLAGDVLSVHQFLLRGREGFLLVDYDRRIDGDDMAVVIRWLRDGQDVVSLEGRLARQGGGR